MIKKLTHQQILAAKPEVSEVKTKPRLPLYVIADNIRSLYNVGAIFRTSDGILAEKLFLCGITGHPPRKEIDKVALGAVEVVPWEYHASAKNVIIQLKAAGVTVCALELTEKSAHFKEANFSFPLALILGNEVEGIGEELMPFADMAVSIPMLGRANSLNVATAYGIVAYEILSHYEKKYPFI